MDQILVEIRRLVELTGNCGRLLTRFIERHFISTDTGLVLHYPAQVAAFGRLHLAMVMAYIKCDMAKTAEVCGFKELPIGVSLFADSLKQQVVFVFNIGALPDGVKARQERLKSLLEAIERTRVDSWVLSENDLRYVEVLLIGKLALNKADVSFSIFEDLVSGDYRRIEDCAHGLVCLANELNPGVSQAYRGPLSLEHMPTSFAYAEEVLDGIGTVASPENKEALAREAEVTS